MFILIKKFLDLCKFLRWLLYSKVIGIDALDIIGKFFVFISMDRNVFYLSVKL